MIRKIRNPKDQLGVALQQIYCFRGLDILAAFYIVYYKDKDKDKDGLLPRSEYMESGCRGVHLTYIHTSLHSDTQGKCMHTIAKIS